MKNKEAEPLLAMHHTRERLASRARWSLSRHASVGILLGSMIAGFALPDGWPVAVVAVCLFATILIVRRDRQRDGFFVNGYRRGRTLPVTIALLVVSFAALHAAILLKMQEGVSWAPVAVGVALAVIATAASVLWQRTYRRELMADPNGR